MSAKPTDPKPDSAPVDDITDKLDNLNANGADADSAAAKKAQKKARQKAAKAAQKATDEPVKQNEDKTNAGDKSEKSKKSKNKSAKKPKEPTVQTDPPTVPISALFPNGNFPEGQIMEHPIGNDDAKAKQRFTSEEARALDRAQLDMYNEIR